MEGGHMMMMMMMMISSLPAVQSAPSLLVSKVWIITRTFWDALDTTVYNPRQLGGRINDPKCYEGGHCQSVLRPHRFFYIHPLCQGDGTAV